MSKLIQKAESIKNRAVIRSGNANKYNLNRTDLHRLTAQDKLERVARGIYLTKEEAESIPFEFSDLFYETLSVKCGVIFALSALAYYGLTDEIPRKFYIAIPASNKAPKRRNAKFYRIKNHSAGIEEIKVTDNLSVRVYSQERSLVDAFKFLPLETSIKALKKYFRNNSNPDIKKIMEYSRILKVKIEPYLQTILTDDR